MYNPFMKHNVWKDYSRKEIGDYGEELAEKYLINKGYEILARKYYSRYGEIDIICKKEKKLIFFEVKTRTNEAFGNPEDSIDRKKIECMISTAYCYIEENIQEEVDWRIDLLAIKLQTENEPEILHFEDINE